MKKSVTIRAMVLVSILVFALGVALSSLVWMWSMSRHYEVDTDDTWVDVRTENYVDSQLATATRMPRDSDPSLQVRLPDDALSGERVIINGDEKAPLDEQGRVTDSAFIEAFLASPRYQAWATSMDGTSLTFQTELATPMLVSIVPAASLYDFRTSTACVIADTGPVAVHIVASKFGTTLVSSETQFTRVTAIAPDSPQTCHVEP